MPPIFSELCSFEQDILKELLQRESAQNTVCIFPTEKSKQAASRLVFRSAEFKRWQLSASLFLTMEEFKELCFVSDKPLLKEEKRTLALFGALPEDAKGHFRINNYFQSLELAFKFFELFEEFNDELVDEEKVLQQIESKGELFDWQRETFRQLEAVKSAYQKFIGERNFEDAIFLYKPDRIDFSFFESYNKLVVVNQYYYTRLEQHLLRQIAGQEKEVKIYHQQFEQNGDDEIFSSKPVSLGKIAQNNFQNARTKQIYIFECKNDFNMIVSLLGSIHEKGIRQIVDSKFGDRPYCRFLSVDQFNLSTSQNFTHTSLYRFFYSLFQLVDSLIFEPIEENILLPIQTLLEAVQVENLFNYFLAKDSENSAITLQEQTLDYLYGLIENDFKYFDLTKKYAKVFPQRNCCQFIEQIIDFLNQLLVIQSISDLIAKIDTVNALIKIEKIISKYELFYSKIRDVFFQALADFKTIEDLGLVKKWEPYFATSKDKTSRLTTTTGILKLFVDYLKAKKVKFNFELNEESTGKRININSLEDTRNIGYDKIAVLNVYEGEIPASRKTPFLFTEKQRQSLNLKTYDEIREREKYYFFRLLLNSSELFLFTQKNIDQNLESSSFVEEIFLNFPAERVNFLILEDKNYQTVYDNFLSPLPYQILRDECRQPEFFQIPLDPRQEFPENELNLNAYSLPLLLENPFVFYINHLTGLTEREKKAATDFSSKLIGKVVHDVINEIWRHLIEIEQSAIFGFDFSKVNAELISRLVNKVLKWDHNYYRFPQNYSQAYFREVIVPVIEEGTLEFFWQLLDKLKLDLAQIEVIPEKEYGTLEEQDYRTFVAPSENDLNIDVRIRGRADLRLIQKHSDKYFIFDYKTGGSDKVQLMIYELYYYLLSQPELANKVNSFFYHVFDSNLESLRDLLKRKDKLETIDALKQNVIFTLNKLNQNGFDLPHLKSKLNPLAEITRKDLYLPLKKSFNL